MKLLIFKVLGVVVDCFLEKYVCVEYLCLQKEQNFWFPHKKNEDTLFDDLSGILISELLLNAVSCSDFFLDENSTLIFTGRRKLASYYLSEVFVMIDQDY